ncbi:MAG: right-handed parallel beta-helix repeat-containing protein [Verrucomicrobia bacterium]|jgi:alpha-L-arabinofuranosidase|nr:right-handed parallel beta-helix repeat-containing protein [Verrucomicrobiota bacterium]
MEYHIALTGKDTNPGTAEEPLRSIQAGAERAQPGDIVTVHKGVYRERVDPPRGGASEEQRIIFQAAPGETVAIKGSEVITGWTHVHEQVWRITVPNAFFGAFNPFANQLSGDWFFPQGNTHHSGAVYLNDEAISEAFSLDEIFGSKRKQWLTKPGPWEVELWVNFGDANPNEELVEINTRQTVFYPSKPGINYITLRGFKLSQAATPWSPPTTEQIGLVGVNWSKGWVIEDNVITHSRCTGLTLGKYFDRDDAKISYGFNAHYQTVKRVLARGDWTKDNIGSHIVRNNHIAYCGQAGIVGSHGGAFCEITGNVIHDIHVGHRFGGFEQAGIKLHAPVDTTISNNLIFNCNMGIWLDWMTQGARISKNAMYDNHDWDLFVEISHGPCLVDNNILMSKVSLLDSAQGGAYVHNLFGGTVRQRPEAMRSTQYFKPHSAECVGEGKVLDGDDRFYNNLILEDGGLQSYDVNQEELWMAGNVFLGKAQPCRLENEPLCDATADNRFTIASTDSGITLELKLDSTWGKEGQRKLVTTERLGRTTLVGQGFENPDGSALEIDTDYFGASRNREDPFPGPFEIPETIESVQIWQFNDRVRAVNAVSKPDENNDEDNEEHPR